MTLRRPASFLVLLIAVAAPLIAGTNVRFAGAAWWVAIPLIVAFAFVLIDRIRARAGFGLPAVAWASGAFLLACLGWWSLQPDRPFATAFAESHWAFLTEGSASAILLWTRHELLAVTLAAWCGFLAVAELARDAGFRGRLCAAIGLTGVAVAALSIAQRAGVMPQLPWVIPGDRAEAFNVSFFHYSGPAVAVNLAWPLLVFSGARGALAWAGRCVVLGIVAWAASTWESAAAQVIAAGLLVTGVGLAWARTKGISTRLLAGGVAAVFVVVAAWQGVSVRSQIAADPDQWAGVEATRADAVRRAQVFSEAADRRGDRLATLTTGNRSTVWLAGARMAAEHPLVGPGPGSWVKDVSLYSNNSMVNTFIHYVQFAHNDLLQIAAEWGGLAALAWLLVWGGALRGSLAAAVRPARNGGGSAGVFLALLGVALHSTVDFPLQYPALLVWSLLLVGAAWSARRPAVASGAGRVT